MTTVAPIPADTKVGRGSIHNKALINVGADVVTTVVLAGLAWQSGAWQVGVVAAVMAVMTLAAMAGLRSIRQGRAVAGVWLVICVPLVVIAVNGLLVADLGAVTGILAIVITLVSAAQLLPGRQAVGATLISTLVAIFVVVMDQLAPPFRYVTSQPVLLLAVVLSGIVVLGHLVIVVREFRDYSLRTKMIVAFLFVSILSMAALTFTANQVLSQSLTDSALQRLTVAAVQVSGGFDAQMRNIVTRLKNEASLPLFIEFLEPVTFRPGSADVEKILRSYNQNDIDNVLSYALLDRDGINVVDSVGSNLTHNEGGEEYFRAAFNEHRSYISPVYFSDEYEQPVIVFSTPVHNVLGQSIGVLRVIYQAGILQDIIETSNDLAGPESYAILLDENQLRLANGPDAGLAYTLVTPLPASRVAGLQAEARLPAGNVEGFSTDLPEFSRGLVAADEQASFLAEVHPEDSDRNHQDWVVVARPESKPEWQIAFLQSPELFLAPVQAQTRVILISMMVILAVVAGIAFGLGQYIAGPIIRLTGVAEQVTAGDFSVQAPVESTDETGLLAVAFNTMTTQLRNFIGSLETQVRERTSDLTLSMELGQQASAIRELEPLLETTVAFLEEQFRVDAVQVYLVDDLGQNLVVAESSQQIPLQARRAVAIGDDSIPGQAAARALPNLVADTRQSHSYTLRPPLPETRSHLAIPLLVEQRVIGVLDLQANTPNTFTQEKLTVFEAVATQLAISIDSARQWALALEAQARAEQALKQLTRQSWSETLETRREALGYSYNLSAVAPATGAGNGDVQVPLTIQNQQVGRLAVSVPPGRRITEDEQELLNAVAQQLAQKAENLRLFNQTQQRASREQMARQIADKMRAAPDVESVIETGLNELAHALGVSRAYVKLTPEQEPVKER
ncbi:MAG: hypothetical protein Kow0031_30800 [Anaerolineae bacterium]